MIFLEETESLNDFITVGNYILIEGNKINEISKDQYPDLFQEGVLKEPYLNIRQLNFMKELSLKDDYEKMHNIFPNLHKEDLSSFFKNNKDTIQNFGVIIADLKVFEKIEQQTFMGLLETNSIKAFDPITDAPELYTSLARIDLFDNRSLLRFCNSYGLPSGEKAPTLFFKMAKPEREPIFFEGESPLAIYLEIMKLKYFLHSWNLIEETNEKYMENLVSRNEGLFQFEDIYEVVGHTPKTLKEKSLNVLIHQLDVEVNKGESSYQVRNEKVVPALRFRNLFEVAYFQLSKAIISGAKMRKCENCGSLFEVTHEGRRFCPPMLGIKTSTCQNTYNQRLKRMRKKEGE